jgi:hypothetical protein
MNPVIALLALTPAFIGLLMNLTLTVDAALTSVPMRWCIDFIAYATFPPGDDCEHGVVISHFCGYGQPCSQSLQRSSLSKALIKTGIAPHCFLFARARRRKCYEPF